MFSNTTKVLGLDIGSNTIKIAELSISKKGMVLEGFATVPTPYESVSNGYLSNVSSVSESLRNILTDLNTKTKSTVTGMAASSVIIKKITIPRVENKVLQETIRFEAEQYIPFDLNSVALSFVPLNVNSSNETMDVLIVAAQNEVILQYMEAVASSGMQCSIMDVNSFALANCFELNYGILKGEAIGLLNFGHEVTNFVVIYDGEVIFSRDLSLGGLNFTSEISRSMGITQSEAESFKISAVSGMAVPDEVHSIMSSENERFVEELKNSHDFFIASNPERKVDRFYFSGGTSLNLQLIEKIAQNLQTPFEKFDPFKKIKVDSKKINLNYASQISTFSPIAIGLASRGKVKP